MTKNSLCRLGIWKFMDVNSWDYYQDCSKVSANAIQNKVIIDALFEAGV